MKVDERTSAAVTGELERASVAWPSVAPILFVPQSEPKYERLVEILDGLIDTVGEDEARSRASLMEVLGALIERYADERVPEPLTDQ